MNEGKSSKVYVEYKEGIYPKSIKLPRKYTLTHSDETGDLFLVVGKDYDYTKINSTRDEVLGNWVIDDDKFILYLEVLLDNDKGASGTVLRDTIFRRELPLAIAAIVRGDRDVLINNPELLEAKIIIKFKSKMPEYNVVEEWGIIKEYTNKIRSEFNESFPLESINVKTLIPHPPTQEVLIPSNPKNKCRSIEEVLITMLGSYIKNQVELSFGRRTPYCLRVTEVLEVKLVNKFGACSQEYEVTVGVRAGKNPPAHNNLLITFLINENRVTVKSVKNPRNS